MVTEGWRPRAVGRLRNAIGAWDASRFQPNGSPNRDAAPSAQAPHAAPLWYSRGRKPPAKSEYPERMPVNSAPTSPSSIQLSASSVTIQWNDGHRSVYSARQLRLRCPCAQCIDEWTGRLRLDPASVPADVYPVDQMPIGSYAVQFLWSDAHYTGLYTHKFLRGSCPCELCVVQSDAPSSP